MQNINWKSIILSASWSGSIISPFSLPPKPAPFLPFPSVYFAITAQLGLHVSRHERWLQEECQSEFSLFCFQLGDRFLSYSKHSLLRASCHTPPTWPQMCLLFSHLYWTTTRLIDKCLPFLHEYSSCFTKCENELACFLSQEKRNSVCLKGGIIDIHEKLTILLLVTEICFHLSHFAFLIF